MKWGACRYRLAVFGGVLLVLIGGLAIAAPLAAPYPPDQQAILQRYRAPDPEHLMGTDGFGRDVFSRAVWASRVSLTVGVVSVLISVVISVLVGGISGFFGGWVDNLLMRLTDLLLVFPTLFLMIAVVAAFGSSLTILVAVLGLMSWQVGARVVRGEVLTVKNREFVMAARTLGAGSMRLLVRHVLPNVVSVVIVSATIRVPQTILLEAGLSYLGLGVQPPTASWGNMVADGKGVLTIAWWASAFPGLFIVATVLGFNLLGDGLRDALDPRMRI
jgi:peptide/nickel transport system permease protein